jgi:hypothetical protein
LTPLFYNFHHRLVQWASTLAPEHVSRKRTTTTTTKKKSKSWNNPSKQTRVPYQLVKPIQVQISRGGERKRS